MIAVLNRFAFSEPHRPRSVLTTIEKRLILRKLGELQEPDRTALRQALAAILG